MRTCALPKEKLITDECSMVYESQNPVLNEIRVHTGQTLSFGGGGSGDGTQGLDHVFLPLNYISSSLFTFLL